MSLGDGRWHIANIGFRTIVVSWLGVASFLVSIECTLAIVSSEQYVLTKFY